MMSLKPVYRRVLSSFFVLSLVVAPVFSALAQGNDAAAQIAADKALLAKETYQMPPDAIAKLVLAPRHLNVSLSQPSPDRRHFLKQESEGLPSVKDFGKPHNYYGGLQVDPKANRNRTLTTRGGVGLSLIDAITGKSTSIQVPPGATVSGPVWSPDGKQLAFIANFETASHVYVADIATAKSVQVTNAKNPLLATLVQTVDWTADGKSVIAVVIPDGRGAEPQKPAIAAGPRVELHLEAVKSPQRQFYTTGQLSVIDVKTKIAKKVGAPAMIQSVDASPDGQFFRVSTMTEPFSYVVQYTSFGGLEQLWDVNGKTVAELQKRPLREVPDTAGGGGGRGGAAGPTGKRGLTWMPNGQGMYFIAGTAPAAGRGGEPGWRRRARSDRAVEGAVRGIGHGDDLPGRRRDFVGDVHG
jgi:hypothetical protein